MSYAASHRSNEEMPAGANALRNYNAEGRRLVESLGLQAGGGMYNAMDAVWKDSSTGGKIYVGNETAARGPASTLAEHGITHVVNCTDDMANFCEGACLPSHPPTGHSPSTYQPTHPTLAICLPRRLGPLVPALQRGLLAVGRGHAGRASPTAAPQ